MSKTKKPQGLKESLVTITEWQQLSLRIKKKEGTGLSINLPEYERISLEAEEKEKEIILYEFGPSKSYPWTNGKYIYTVQIEGRSYYGLLEVQSKNITEDEFTNMHKYLESKLKGISHEYTERSETLFVQASEESAYFQLEQWILNNIDNLIETLYSIERNFISHFRKVYITESVPKRIDRKSLEWAHGGKGSIFEGQKHYNRRYQLTANAPENRFVKMATLTIMKHMKKIVVEKENQLLYIEREIKDFKDKIESIKETIKQVLATNRYTRTDINRRKNQKQNIKRDLERSRERQEDLVNTLRVLEANYQKVNYILHNTFWKYVSYTQSRNTQLTNKKYSSFQKLWNTFVKIEGSLLEEKYQLENQTKNQILHPTPVLYEYYTFFKLSDIFRKLDFQLTEKSEGLKLSSGFYELLPGSSIHFTKGNLRIDIIYEEEVDYDANIAIENESYFFSREESRRPDIRIDLYNFSQENKDYLYESSIVFEVKYRPLANIYSTVSYTKEMRQMGDYHSIRRYCQYRKDYIRGIKNVHCIYPGDEEELKISSENGLYMILRPQREEEFEEAIIEEIKNWLVEELLVTSR